MLGLSQAERKLVCQVFAYRPLVGVTNLSFGDVEANQASELARIRQEEVLFSAPVADVDEDVGFADLGRLKHLEAEPLAGAPRRPPCPRPCTRSSRTCGPSGAIPGRSGTGRTVADGTRERGGDLSHGKSDTGRHSSAHCRERPPTQHDQGSICVIAYLGFVAADSVSGGTVL